MKLNLSAKKLNARGKTVPVGTYSSEVLAIGFHPDYANDSAILVKYKLTDTSGKDYPYGEIFYNDIYNDRSRSFFDYLSKNGISMDAIETFVGCKEKVTIKKDAKRFVTHMTIVDREFISRTAGDSNDLASKK